MRSAIPVLTLAAMGCLAACSSSPSEHALNLRAALDKADLSLSDAVTVGEADTVDGISLKAALLVDADPVFSVGALATQDFRDVRVDIVSGNVLSNVTAPTLASVCPGSIPITQAIAIAEAEVDGEAVSIEPDDDGGCNREVKVLSGTTLWEVKVGPTGSVVESEEDDEG